ncbi:MAG: hypothetical protein ABSD57_08345 [Verrucomicrobiota bacterium]|jgi:hypothetical protein
MNTKARRNKFFHCGRIIAALLAGVFLISKTPAQPVTRPVENRFLLVFDTSSDMKKRLPAVQRALDTMLASNMRGQLHAGDSIGVWTFDREARTGQFPLQRWAPENAAMIASNIIRFVAKQHYSKKTSFDALRPYLNWVVQNSDRLTVLIFCDGDGEITLPFDSGINRIFQQQQAERKKARQPFILVLRSQLGNYTGWTVDLPPALVSFPEFPPLPQPPMEPTNAPSPPPPPPRPLVEAPPLIIIGTKTGTNLPPPEPTPAPPVTTNQPPPTVAVPPTNVIANVETNLPSPVATVKPTNELVAPPANLVAPAVAIQTNAMAPPPESSGLSSKRALVIGAAFLVLAGVLTILLLGRSRKTDHGSLITRSMNKGGKPSART